MSDSFKLQKPVRTDYILALKQCHLHSSLTTCRWHCTGTTDQWCGLYSKQSVSFSLSNSNWWAGYWCHFASHRAGAGQCMAAENQAQREQRVTEKVCRISKSRSLPRGLTGSVVIALLSGTLLKFQHSCEALRHLPARLAKRRCCCFD